jgi:uncharacterized protein (DUF2384 family)
MALQVAYQKTAPIPQGLEAYDAEQVAAVAAKAYARIVGAWRINNAEAAELIAVSARTWARMKTGAWVGKLNRDQLLRISAMSGLYKALHLYFSDELADRWISLRNSGPLFAGREPVAAMIEGGLPVIMETRNYVDALRGGA